MHIYNIYVYYLYKVGVDMMGTSAQARDQSAPLSYLPELQFQSLPDSISEHTEDITDIMICRYRAAPIASSYEPRGEVLFIGGV